MRRGLAGLSQPQGQSGAHRPQAAQAGRRAQAVVEAAEVAARAADLRAQRSLDPVLDVGQARRGVRAGSERSIRSWYEVSRILTFSSNHNYEDNLIVVLAWLSKLMS